MQYKEYESQAVLQVLITRTSNRVQINWKYHLTGTQVNDENYGYSIHKRSDSKVEMD